ncbi:preprotein translocase subunit SecG [Thioclava sp. A2]|uniref:preprotein translocase subunit SecG n=1 Tax=Thioclava sp. FCG-A2 TaxID=3080562 RepID=UPI00295343D2|nr:preprotein translocase subunit SecG [Thioclava sp. A2]MDV7269289.1 preprotein translocase subunit SecG [Thioclava sp. A2]
MENVILSIHLILALLLIGVVLLQRSEGGGLGMGGGSGVMSGRQAANALSKLTWGLAIAFLITSVTLTVLAARKAGVSSVMDQLVEPAPAVETPVAPAIDVTPPPAADAPVTPPAAN